MDAPPYVRIDHISGTHVEIVVEIDDTPSATLPDAVAVGLFRGIASLICAGVNVRVQCGASVSRSSYCTVGVIMVLHQLRFDPALAIVQSSHPQANPNVGFTAHLRQLEAQLSEGA
jgi:hypothetical protein